MNKAIEYFLTKGFPVWGKYACTFIKTVEAEHNRKEEQFWKDLGIEKIEGNEDWVNAKDAA